MQSSSMAKKRTKNRIRTCDTVSTRDVKAEESEKVEIFISFILFLQGPLHSLPSRGR